MSRQIPLLEAITRYLTQKDATPSRVKRYREEAKRRGCVSVGDTRVPATKVEGRWIVDENAFAAAAAAANARERAERLATARADEDYEAHRLRDGTVTTTWGGYLLRGAFHLVWTNRERALEGSDGLWMCNGCWKAASTEHEKPECHRCSDWSPCNTDCTLSRVFCEACGTSLVIP